MNRLARYSIVFCLIGVWLLASWWSTAANKDVVIPENFFAIIDSLDNDESSDSLKYPFKDRKYDPYADHYDNSGMYGSDPKNVRPQLEYDPVTGRYYVTEQLGALKNRFFRNPSYLTFEEYTRDQYDRSTKDYWKTRAASDAQLGQKKPFAPKLNIGGELFDRIFGGNQVDIRPQGFAELTFGVNSNFNNSPQLSARNRRVTIFDFRQRIQMNVIANIGEKLKFNTNYNTEATFDFENQMKLDYTGYEDEIIKKIEAGNVNLPLNTSLITGSQSLFGVKTQLQFGRLKVTGLLSQQKGTKSTIELSGTGTGSGQVINFQLGADNYEANKHYFLGQYFKDRFDSALSDLPKINSEVIITRAEVWVTNRAINAGDVPARNMVAFMDLGEKDYFNKKGFIPQGSSIDDFPQNTVNGLYDKAKLIPQVRNFNNPNPITIEADSFQLGIDYERLENARLLDAKDYTLNTRLGYISLNQSLNADEVLAVAYEYQVGNTVYRVGELVNSGVQSPNALILKLLKPKNLNTNLPMWDLMMKNIYSIGAFNINNSNFKMDIQYLDNSIGSRINYIPEGQIKGIPLVRVLNLDNINNQGTQRHDGVFDFLDGITINASSGRIIFPVREPFGSYLRSKIGDPSIASRYAFDTLYRATKQIAQLDATKNKFFLKGNYQSSSSSEISLNAFNIPQGAVSITAGGNKLVENQDYTVDYALGRVKIINDGILSSGIPIKISTESNALFSVQTRTLMGSRLDYTVNKNFLLGGTILNLSERPLTQKVNIGEEPISNTIFGFDGTYKTSSRFLTRLVDKIPFLDTKEESEITISGEYAQLVPGHAKIIGSSGTSYIDDFEASKSPIDLRGPTNWVLSSTPQGQSDLFPEARLSNDLRSGYNRAKLSWYTVDPLFFQDFSTTPSHLTKDDKSDPFSRNVLETELFPNKTFANGQVSTLPVFNLAYYPTLRGPYNFDVNGVNADGNLLNPKSRWAGIMRRIETSDFESANIEFLEFWMMDPFAKGNNAGGNLYFNLGSVSEDILKDGRKSFENGLPTSDAQNNTTIYTKWARVPSIQSVVPAFDNNTDARALQDVGYDGLGDNQERSFYDSTYIRPIINKFGAGSLAAVKATQDPSSDNFHFPLGSDYDDQKRSILKRYSEFNGTEANSKVAGNTPVSSTNRPDFEDINNDNTLDEIEAYYQFHVELKPEKMNVGQNYITSIITTLVTVPNGQKINVKWYQFRIPIRKPEKIVGGITDFRSIRFMRMFLHGFQDSVICRFGRLQLIRGEWRKYTQGLQSAGEQVGGEYNESTTSYDLSTISLEEDGNRIGIPYTIPPGIKREVIYGTNSLQKLNEQSLQLRICGLKDGDARSTYKNTQLDLRQYKHIKLYAHLQSIAGISGYDLKKGDVKAFIRLGTDFDDNYYEYEVPLTPTPDNSKDPDAIWPAENEIDIALDKLLDIKEKRNIANYPLNKVYPLGSDPANDGENKISVKGVPSVSNIRNIMLGVRNTSKNNDPTDSDDGQDKCVEVWFNELRMTDFVEKGGWAATGRINAKLADFGIVAISGSKSTPGFGSIEQKITERKIEDATQYDISSSFEMGKFLPPAAGLKVPLFLGYSQQVIVPQFNPLDPDVKVKDIKDDTYRNTVTDQIQDITTRKSVNVTNFRKVKTSPGSKPHIWDVENLNATFAYSELFRRSINIESNEAKTYKAALGYGYNNTAKNFEPFKELDVKSPFWKPIGDFNFSLLPNSISLRAEVDRYYAATKLRPVGGQNEIIDPTYDKRFNFNRFYTLNWDITKSLKLDFNATNNAVVDEPYGPIDTQQKKDSIKQNFFPGRTTRYHHNSNLNYNIPIQKLPYLDWTTLTYRYTVDYDWSAGPRIDLEFPYGNTIQNSTSTQINGKLNFAQLFNKSKYFRYLKNGKEANNQLGANMLNNKLNGLLDQVSKKGIDTVKGKKGGKGGKNSDEKSESKGALDFFARLLIGFQSADINLTKTQGTQLPGFMPATKYLGQNYDLDQTAPGWAFVAGKQNDFDDKINNIRYQAARNGWLSNDPTLNIPFTQTDVNNFNARLTYEPVRSLRMEFNATRNASNNLNEYFRYDNTLQDWGDFNRQATGNLSISFLSISSAFGSTDDKTYDNKAWDDFKSKRFELSQRLSRAAVGNVPGYTSTIIDSTGYYDGFGPTAQNVLVPAFIAAYGGQSAGSVKSDPFALLPVPNWRITYDGLARLSFFQKWFSNVSLGHAYRSTLSVNNFNGNIDYFNDKFSRNQIGDFNPKDNYAGISITEAFSPLISVDLMFKSGLTSRFEYKTTRNVSLSMSNNQLTEMNGTEWVFGGGYRLRKFKLPFKFLEGKLNMDNDLDLKLDLSYRNSETFIRKLVEDFNQPVNGSNIITIKAYADYILSERVNLRVFYENQINKPKVSAGNETRNVFAGISLRLILSQ